MENVGVYFQFKLKGHSLQNFLLPEIERMQNQTNTSLLLPSLTSTQHIDIFAKYMLGVGVSQMPFRIFKAECPIRKNRRKSGARGPYRRYTPEEKLQIIQRMLSGQSLKKIAEKTMIPKRNLIRWKHEYLYQHKYGSTELQCEDQSVQLECAQPLTKKQCSETRQLLVGESMDSIRMHQVLI